MSCEEFGNNWVHMYIAELTSRIVAESGIPSDRFHLGKIVLQCLKDDPEFIMQIDGGTGKSETNGSVLRRSVQCASALTDLNLNKGDVMVLMAPNHLDLAIPFYAGWFLGLTVAPVDRTLELYELQRCFEKIKPKIVFCQSENVLKVQNVAKLLETDIKIVTFDKCSDTLSFTDMLEMSKDKVNFQGFRATDFDPGETISALLPTSGTTGFQKAAVMTHKSMAISVPYLWEFSTTFPTPTRLALLMAPLQWLTSILSYTLGPILKYSRLQSSSPTSSEHFMDLIQKYEPTFAVTSPTMLSTLVKLAEERGYNFSSFENLSIGGSAVSTELLKQIKKMSPKTLVTNTYGMTETGSMIFQGVGAPLGSCGTRTGHLQYRLIDPETKKDIKEPNKQGELWLKGLGIFQGYYNDPKATEEAFSADGWFMTGDLMYRDENWNYYFAERLKLLLKFRGYHISPRELEEVIHQHPGVMDVAVTGVPDPECGDLPVACVVLRSGCVVTAEDIKNLVKENLAPPNQLRGGVLFMNELPLTPSTKVHRRKLKQIALERMSELDSRRD